MRELEEVRVITVPEGEKSLIEMAMEGRDHRVNCVRILREKWRRDSVLLISPT